MDSFEIASCVASWLRYQKQCPVVALEAPSNIFGNELADVLAITRGHYLIEVEVKVSMQDFRRDRNKIKHESFRKMSNLPYKQKKDTFFGTDRYREPNDYPTRLFYFAVPIVLGTDIAKECDEIYPYAGVLGFNGLYGPASFRKARVLQKNRITDDQFEAMANHQSATLCRLMSNIVDLKKLK